MLKGDGTDEAIRDAVMMGASRGAAVRGGALGDRRSRAPLRDDRRAAVAAGGGGSAAKQCGRAVVPEMAAPVPFAALLAAPVRGHRALLLVEPSAGRVTSALAEVPAPAAVTLAVGPEGGWTDDEVRRRRTRPAGCWCGWADARCARPARRWRRWPRVRPCGGTNDAARPQSGDARRPQEQAMTRVRWAAGVVAMVALVAAMTGRGAAATATAGSGPADGPDPVATFSILGFDPATGEVGGAVQSRVFSVGNGVLWAEAGVGAAATQAIVDVSYGPKAIALLRAGLAPDGHPQGDLGQRPRSAAGAVDQAGPAVRRHQPARRGRDLHRAEGHASGPAAGSGKYCTAQGNILAGEAVVTEMVRAFETTTGHLSQRLTAALEAGQAAGGDTRGMQSAAILIVGQGQGVWLNNDVVMRLQVDDSPEPIKELRRLVTSWNERRVKGQQRPVK